jgi:sugar/nucleoside kinase (ribokinase family)
VSFEGIHTPDRPTTLKRRFVDNTFKHKLFEAIEIEDAPLEGRARDAFHEHLDRIEDQYDMVLVADFGHGLMDKESVQKVCQKDVFLAVNAQTNSANKGFNLLTKYPRADHFSIDKDEAELALHEKHADPEWALRELIEKTSAKFGSITLGVDGSLSMDRDGEQAYVPILTSEVVDTIGAGDAFLSLSSLFAKDGASVEEMGFVGNASGAMAVKILGNKSFIEKTALLKYLKTLLS